LTLLASSGVGDNGAWAPIGTRTLPAVPASSARSDSINWTPTVGEHTCLKVFASPQFGEITASNNQCQENVFYFAPAASSPPDPVRMKVAVRNPLDYDSPILLTTANVPDGYVVHVPHKWLHLPAKGERRIELTIIPLVDINQYKERKIPFRTAPIQLRGHLPHEYTEALPITDVPAATHRTIGGITASVTPKRRGEIKAEPDSSCKSGLGVRGNVTPGLAGQAVTVTVRPVGGTSFSVETKTGPGGRFAVCIDPRASATTTAQEPWEAKQKETVARFGGLYEIVCETFDATDIAYARSKPIYVDLRGARPRTKERPAQTPQVTERVKARTKVVRLPEGDLTGVPPAERIVGTKGEPAVAASFSKGDE
jgi:hypothetical protein